MKFYFKKELTFPTLSHKMGLVAFILGSLTVLFGSLHMIPLIVTIGLDLTLDYERMDPELVKKFGMVRLAVIVGTGLYLVFA